MWKYATLLSYVGTNYRGWQAQKGSAALGGPGIQTVIEAALHRITGEDARAVGSGRTDSGVHAVGQVAHFVLKKKNWNPLILRRALNSALPAQIRTLDLVEVPLEFHAQRSAMRKQYSYYFQQGPCALPPFEPYSWWIQKRLDLKAMQEALDALIGEHDFKPFRASGAKPGPSVRTVFEAQVTFDSILFPGAFDAPGMGWVRVRVVGSGFLKQMVRGIAGTLLQVGEGRRPPTCFKEILDSQDRTEVGPTAPARALWLERVWYPFDLFALLG